MKYFQKSEDYRFDMKCIGREHIYFHVMFNVERPKSASKMEMHFTKEKKELLKRRLIAESRIKVDSKAAIDRLCESYQEKDKTIVIEDIKNILRGRRGPDFSNRRFTERHDLKGERLCNSVDKRWWTEWKGFRRYNLQMYVTRLNFYFFQLMSTEGELLEILHSAQLGTQDGRDRLRSAIYNENKQKWDFERHMAKSAFWYEQEYLLKQLYEQFARKSKEYQQLKLQKNNCQTKLTERQIWMRRQLEDLRDYHKNKRVNIRK